MLFLRDLSIRKKLTTIIMVTSCVALIIACIIFVIYDRVSIKNSMRRNIKTLAQMIGSNCTAALIFNNEFDAEETLQALKAEKQVIFACVYTLAGDVFATYKREAELADIFPPIVQNESIRFSRDFLVLFQPIILDEEEIGTIYIQMDLSSMQVRLLHYWGIVSVVMLLSILIVLFLISKFQHLISKPIIHLSTIAKDVSEKKDYSIRAEKFGDDEVGYLIERFNEMLEQIHERDEELQKTQDELELRVQDRTAELAESNKALQEEIGERKRAEKKIKASLQEKEVLLKEIHHRVKNNLQVISSLLHLQSRQVKDNESLELFRESQDRVRSMALVHEKLYGSKDFARIDFAGYIDSLANSLYRAYEIDPSRILLDVKVSKVYLSVDMAVPFGLVINELISNALKHAFPQTWDGQGKIEIFLEKTGKDHVELIIRDNGIGIPDEIDIRKTESLGLHLVIVLVEEQIEGKVNVNRSNGTEFHIQFKAET